MRTQKGSFTIEATIWISLISCFMIQTLEVGLSFYEKSTAFENVEELEDWDVIARFYEIWAWKELGERIENE